MFPLPLWLPRPIHLNTQPHILTSFALSLLLVFRTNSSYARWEEALKLLGGVLTHSRSLVQQGCSFFVSDKSKRAMARWTVAYVVTLHDHMQEEVDLEPRLKEILEPDECALVMAAEHKVLQVLHVMAEILKREQLNIYQVDLMTRSITFLYEVLGSCERIFFTPIPVSYTRHTCRFMLIWLTTLPLGLYSAFQWATIPVTGVIALLLLGIDEIGMQIEEPFGIIDFDSVVGRIVRNVDQILERSKSTMQFADRTFGAPHVL
eukprot:gene10151-8054_t